MFGEAIFEFLLFQLHSTFSRFMTDFYIFNPFLGDSLYPETEDTPGAGIEEKDFISEETSKNRISFSSPNLFRISCNIVDPCGHKQPRDLVKAIKETTIQSQM